MKKFIYILLFSLVSASAFTACSEEAVEPKLENGGGSGSADGKN
jgi:hypothetical protein